MSSPIYCNSLIEYSRRKTITVNIGDVPMGSDYPIRVQSMTTIDTMDTEGSIAQTIRMIESGCEYVRITAPSVKEAQNLENIKKGLRLRGYTVPLVADIHFTPNAAELAARIVEKVRINPGNYADKKRFETIEYTESDYQKELDRIREKFVPLVKICKEYGTAMRIGTNHGSLSDRIMSRYGDSAVGMVESALEFLRICDDMNYHQVVLSMKSSNTLVMVEAYRLLVSRLNEEKLQPYPLHLGVTEAGEGSDGRIKSAVGIGTLLEDGLGDTVRVSLTEDPEFEAPVARSLISRYVNRANETQPIKSAGDSPIDPYQYVRHKTDEVYNFGGVNVPRVIADYSHILIDKYETLKPVGYFYLPAPDKWHTNDLATDFVYTGHQPATFMLPNGLKEIVDYGVWLNLSDQSNKFPMLNPLEYHLAFAKNQPLNTQLNFLKLGYNQLTDSLLETLKAVSNVVLVLHTQNVHAMPELRQLCFELTKNNILCPVVIQRTYSETEAAELSICAATDCGGLLVDGFGDGIMLSVDYENDDIESNLKLAQNQNNVAFGILQAARTRMSKTEYISCPSCGRTLFDLQETTAMIRKRTDHLKGLKIGIMGCIVNGPGEMADADYGYVGIGKDKISLYRGQNVVSKSVHADKAVDELIALIKEDGRWNEPEIVMSYEL
jgi:(E)-4-hydroxy-3-methylbut-2-enyl-diphosphate synthase